MVNQLAPTMIGQPDAATAIDPELLDWEYDATLAGRTNYTDEAIEEMKDFEDARTTRRSNRTQASSTLRNTQSLASREHSSTQSALKKDSHTNDMITYDSLGRNIVDNRPALRIGVRKIVETTSIC